MATNDDPLKREVLLAFWKIHILHHAEKQPVYGQWMLEELAEHGYRLSPGTLYPILARMEQNGWLRANEPAGPRARRDYRITASGQQVLRRLRKQITELYDEVVRDSAEDRGPSSLPAGRRKATRT